MVLHAVAAVGRRGQNLHGIVYEADYSNRMVYHRDEMEGALRRLIGSGLVTDRAGRYRVTRTGRSVYKQTRAKFDDEHRRQILVLLVESVPCTPTTDWSLAAEIYESAVARHRRLF